MRKFMNLLLPLWMGTALLNSCDSGDIIEKSENEVGGLSCSLSVDFLNTATWPVDYQIVLGAFGEDDYPLISKGISKPAVGDTVALTLAGIPEKAKEISIALLNKSRKRVTSFQSITINDAERKSSLVTGGHVTVDLLAYNRIQNQFFANCVNCHGASERAAAGLFLTEGKSYNALVGVASTKEENMLLVAPGLVEQSFIIQVLEGKTDKVHYDHTNVSFNSESEDITLLKNWISNLE